MLTVSLAVAQTAYWDTNGATAGSGNLGGNWLDARWTTDADGAVQTGIWTNGDSAVFSAGTDGVGTWTVNLVGTISTPSIRFAQTGTKTIAGGTINIGGGSINSTALGFAPGNGDDINLNTVLEGAGGLTIAAHGDATSNSGGGGGAELRLGANNTFSGGLTVTSGLVSWNTDANLGDISNIITLNGGGILSTGASHSTVRAIKVGAAGGTFRNYGSTTLTLNGPISNADGVASTTIRRTDGGTLRLNGSGAGFTGTWINGAGSTQFTNANADWANTDFMVDGGNLTANGTGTVQVRSINSTADVIADNGTTIDVKSGAITMRTGHVYRSNAGDLGKLTSSSGTLAITNGAGTGNLTTVDHQIQMQIVNSGATPVALVKNNNNSLVLTRANTFSGGTTINGGRIQPTNPTAFGTGGVTVNNGAQAFLTASGTYPNSFTINGNGVVEGAGTLGALRLANAAAVSGSINVASNSRITTFGGGDNGSLSGAITGTANLEKDGVGSLTILGDASGFTGTLTTSAGTLRLGGALGGNLVMNGGTTLGGKGSVAGSLTLGSATGINMEVNGSIAGSLSTNDLTVNGLTNIRLTGLPAVAGSPITVLTYSGSLEMTGAIEENFALANAASYRAAPVFADSGTAITLTVPAGANLVWRGNAEVDPTFWNNNLTLNWENTATNAPDVFFAGDSVLFDDTGVSKTVALQGLLSPASVTFNNSAGNDYTLTGAGGNGFTGATGIVKNGTGTTTIQGFSHNYTGKVVINDGILQPSGNYELLGNSSGVTINDSANGGGQLNINGMNLGNGTRHYSVTIAGNGANGNGAITNTSTNSPNENAGLLNLTLSADASVGSTGGRYDIGRSGGSFGAITGNGFTLTKVGSGTVAMRAAASDLTYVVSAGTLKFEDSDLASGLNPIAVNAGTLQGWGIRTFANTLNLAAGTTLDNDGGGLQTWTGPVNLTGTLADSVNLRPRNGAITLRNAISGNSNVRIDGNNILFLTGSASNTYTGTTTLASTGQLVLSKTGGATAIPGDLIMAATGTRAIASASQDNQFGAGSVLRYTGGGDNRLELKGTTQTLGGIDNTGATGYNNIQHSEFGNPPAVDGLSDLIINVAGENSYTYSGVLRDQGGRVNLTKSGTGTQRLLGGLIDFTGTTQVTAGRLLINSDDTWTSSVTIAAGAVYEANVTSLTDTLENRGPGYTLLGTGTYQKTGPGNLSMGWAGGASVAMESGALIDIAGGEIRLEYGGLTTWTNNKSDLTIAAGAALNLWDNNNAGVFVNALNGGGAVTRIHAQTGNITVGVDGGSGDFSGSISNASGRTNLVKAGSGTQTLSGTNTYSGNTTVLDGTLALAASGSLRFIVNDVSNNRITGTGAATIDGTFAIDTSAVTVTSGSWTLVDTATLTSSFGSNFSTGIGWTESANVWTMTVGDQIWTFSEASGELSLGSASSYASWIGGFFPGETDADIIGASADPDNDGIPNAVEMIIGGNPAAGMDTALLPTLELVTDPTGLPVGDYLLFTYRRTDSSVAAGITASFEYNTALEGAWSEVENGVDGVVILEDDNYDSFAPPAEDTDRVRVYLPRNTDPVLFGRLRAVVP